MAVASYEYTTRVRIDVVHDEVPRTVPQVLTGWVRPAIVDSSPWWQWAGVGDSDPEVAWKTWQKWRSEWSSSYAGPSVAMVRWASRVSPEWDEVLGSRVDPARCATLLLAVQDILAVGQSYEVASWRADRKVVGYSVPGALHVLHQGHDEELLLTQDGVWLESRTATSSRTCLHGWSVSAQGETVVEGCEVEEGTGQALLELGRYNPKVRCQVTSMDETCRQEWLELSRGLTHAVEAYKYALVHTLQ